MKYESNISVKKGICKSTGCNVTSVMCTGQERSGLDVQCLALVKNFNAIFSNGHVPGWTINGFPPFAKTRTMCASSLNNFKSKIKKRELITE